MNVARALLTGFVEVRAKPAAEGGAHRVLTLAEKPGVATTLWKVVLATPEADAEAGELAEGEAVAFAGAVIHGRSREGVALRSLTADRALALSTPAVSSPKLDEADHVTGDQIREMFRQVESHSQILGVVAERSREAHLITDVLVHPLLQMEQS